MSQALPSIQENAEEEFVTFADVASFVATHWRALLTSIFAGTVLGYAGSFLLLTKYTATARLLPPQQQSSAISALASQLGALSGVVGSAAGVRNPSDTLVALLKSRTVADRLIDRFDLLNVYNTKYRQDARKTLTNASMIRAGRDGIITVDVDDTDPQRATDIANAYAEELGRLNATIAVTEAQQRRKFFEQQLAQTNQNLKKAQAALEGTGTSPALMNSAPAAMVERVARLRAQVTALEVRLATMRGYLTESSPELQLAQRELSSMRAQLSQEENLRKPAANGNGNGEEYLGRFRDYRYQEALYELMAKQYELARLDEAREGALIQVIDSAVVPERRSWPSRSLIAGALALVALTLTMLFLWWHKHGSKRSAG